MPYYVCEEHALAWPSYAALISHFVVLHKGEERPTKEEAEREELPDGVELRESKRRRQLKEEREEKEVKPPAKEYIVDELPTEPPELLYALLRLKGIGEQPSQRLRREFRLSPWMWGDAQEIASLLKGAKLGIGADWIRSFLKQYGNTAEIPSEDGGIGFVGQKRSSRDEFFGQLTPQASQDPLSTYLRFQTMKESRADEERQRAPDPETERRMKSIETSNQQLMETQNKLLELLEKQERDAREAALEARFVRLEGLLTQRSQQDDEGGGWLSKFLEEREKRYETLIKDFGDKLANATSEVTEAKKEAKVARAEAIADEQKRFDDVKHRLEESGFISRAKTTEERGFDLLEEQLAPAVIGEVKEGRKLLERIAGSATKETALSPVSTEEASSLAAILEVEQQLKATP